MFTGTKNGNSTGFSLKTGLSSFQLLGVNPTQAQIIEWTGYQDAKEPDYSVTDDFSKEHQVRPLNIYLKNDDDVVVNFRINISKDDYVAKTGNYKVCTSDGSCVWAKADGAVKPEFIDHKCLKIGEEELITFIAKLINFDYKSGENLYAQMTASGLDAQTLYNGNFAGFAKLAAWCLAEDKHIVMLLEVREKVDGDKTKHYQGVCNKPETWFSGQVTDWTKNKLKERYEKSLEVGAGQTQAYPLTKAFFSYDYQDFDKSKVVNSVPDNPAVTSGGWN